VLGILISTGLHPIIMVQLIMRILDTELRFTFRDVTTAKYEVCPKSKCTDFPMYELIR